MSSTASSPASTSTASCASVPYTLPTQDVACAVAHASASGLPSNYTSIMSTCCKTAPVETFASGCALYCLAAQQSVADLIKCLQEGGVDPGYVFCNGNNTATATGDVSKTSATGAATSSPTGKEGVAGKGVERLGLGSWAAVGLVVISGALGLMV